jgi:pimeloyl-ACP methyl ester carboxylesterase
MDNTIRTVTSKDGTPIAYERSGDGPPIILVSVRSMSGPPARHWPRALEPDFTTFVYDRRGRGASGDTAPYAIEREIEDLAALIGEAGGSAAVFGYSSGAALALHAAAAGVAVTKLALYDLPWTINCPGWSEDHAARPGADRRESTGRRSRVLPSSSASPDDVVAQMRHAPLRPALEAIAHPRLRRHRHAGGRMPDALPGSVAAPTLAIAGGAGAPLMRDTATALADALPNGRSRILEGQTHDIDPATVTPVLEEFLSEPNSTRS